jgi:hypothetical protein
MYIEVLIMAAVTAQREYQSAFAIVNRVEQRLTDLCSDDCTKKVILENLGKLFYYYHDLEEFKHVPEIKRARNILFKGFKKLTTGSRMSDRLYISKYEMQGSKFDLMEVYRRFLREMKRLDYLWCKELI